MACTAVVANKPFAHKMKAPKTCAECDQAVYPLEQVSAGQFVYHKWCFRCAQCNRTLSTSNYAVAPSGIPYCKPHFTSTLKLRGGFEEFAVSYVQPSTDLTVGQSAGPADSHQIVRWSTKPRELQPVNSSVCQENLTDLASGDDDGTMSHYNGSVSRVKTMFEAMR